MLNGSYVNAEVFANAWSNDVGNNALTSVLDTPALHHVVMVSTTGSPLVLFVDGVKIEEAWGGNVPAMNANTLPLRLGYSADWNAGASYQWEGWMRRFAIYPSALSEARIAAHYAAGSA